MCMYCSWFRYLTRPILHCDIVYLELLTHFNPMSQGYRNVTME